MLPDALLALAAAEGGVTPAAVERVECPTCRETTLVLLEVGACINPECRETQRLGVCHSCKGIAFNGAFRCEECRCG